MSKKQVLILFGIFLLAFTIRVFYLPSGGLTFAFDQARDAFIVRQIISGDLKIIGPSVSGIPGFYHGVLYYYFILPAYYFGRGSPIVAAYWMAFFNSLVVFLVFCLAFKLTKDKLLSYVASILFAFSFEETQYATWLSNPAMGVWFVALLYLGLILWSQKKHSTLGAIIAGFGFGLSIQSNLSLMYHLTPILIWLIYIRNKVIKKDLILFTLSLFVSTSTILAAQIKFNFPGYFGIVHLIRGFFDTSNGRHFYDFILKYSADMNQLFTYNLFPQSLMLGSIAGWLLVFYALKNTISSNKQRDLYVFCMLWILSYFPASILGGDNRPHIGVGIGVGLMILASNFLMNLQKKHKLLAAAIFLIVIFFNTKHIFNENVNGQTIFAIQKDMTLEKELAAIDFTYLNGPKEKFSISTLTSPLYINTTWAYLYDWYGKKVYGFLPYWMGRDQIGSLGDGILKSCDSCSKNYLIVEDMTGIPNIYLTYFMGDADAVSTLVETRHFGMISVQERKLLKSE